MVLQPARGTWVIVATVMLALLLSVAPLPMWAQWGRPEWMAMVLIYWLIALPNRVGIGVAWGCGLLLDIVEGAPLGQNCFSLAVLAYLALILYQRLRMFSPWQQAGVVFILTGLHQLLGNWVQTLYGAVAPDLLFLLPAVISGLLWPWLVVILRFCRRYFNVS
jgi:rod shape-determining protein MreD